MAKLSIKPVNVNDVVAGKKYTLGATRIKSRNATIAKIFGKEIHDYRYSKTKGFFAAQLLIVEHYMNSHDTIAVHFEGEVLLNNIEQLKANAKDFVLFEYNEFKAYVDYIFKDKDNVRKEYNDNWDSTVFNRNPSAIFDGDMTLPRYLARNLKSDLDWNMYRSARNNFKELLAA